MVDCFPKECPQDVNIMKELRKENKLFPKKKRCPICDQFSDRFNVEKDQIIMLKKHKNQGGLKEFLTITKIYSDLIEQGTPTANLVAKATNAIQTEIKKTSQLELSTINTKINKTIQTTLKQTLEKTIPDPKDLATLNKLLPQLTLLIHQVIQQQTKPTQKGRKQEKELHQELTDYYPEDKITHHGGPDKTDIKIQPRQNGQTQPTTIIIESKNNKHWTRNYIKQVQKHMAATKTRYAILAVKTMPKGTRFYLTEQTPEGTIYITQTKNTKLVYGALRTILLTTQNKPRTKTLQETIQETKIQEAINTAYTTTKYLQEIRKQANKNKRNNNKIIKNANQADQLIKTCLGDMQTNIQHAITQEQQHSQTM